MNQDTATVDADLPTGPVRTVDTGDADSFRTRGRMRTLVREWDGRDSTKQRIIRRAFALGLHQAVAKVTWKPKMAVKQDVSAAERRRSAESGAAFSDGSYPINDEKELEAAIDLVGNSKSHSPAEVKAHIMKRAKALGLTDKLPDDWKVNQEALSVQIIFQEGIGKPVVLQESDVPAGVMRIRAPFYVGESVNKPRGWTSKMYFPTKTLPGLVQEGNAQIEKGKQPITVYARHAHAEARDQMPIGAVRRFEQEDRIGYAIVDVLPTDPHGRNTQLLLEQGLANAMSMRSGPGSYKLGKGKVNGEEVLVFEAGSRLDGIDFAPDGPAQPTYGIELLNEEARVESLGNVKKDRRMKLPDADITLEDVPEDVRGEIERPLREENKALKERNVTLQQEKDLRERNDYLREIAKNTSDPEQGYTAMVALCDDKKVVSHKDAAAAVTPILLEALAAAKASKDAEPKISKEEMIRNLFVTPSGRGIVRQEDEDEKSDAEEPAVDEEHEMTAAGLYIPGEE